MDPNRDVNIWSLAARCRRLTELADALANNRAQLDVSRLVELNRLVALAAECLEHGSTPAQTVAPTRKGFGGLLSRVLGSSDAPAPVSAPAAGDTPPSPQHSLALRGHDQLIPTPDLVTFLASQRKRGVLEVVTPVELFVLEFDNGDIVHAQSNRTPDGQRLGDILVTSGAIERAELELVLQTIPSTRLGETLIARERITQAQFLEALRVQIQSLFQRLFEQPASRFSFWSGPPIHADSQMRLNATALLLDGARAFDEMTLGRAVAACRIDTQKAALPGPAAGEHAAHADWFSADKA